MRDKKTLPALVAIFVLAFTGCFTVGSATARQSGATQAHAAKKKHRKHHRKHKKHSAKKPGGTRTPTTGGSAVDRAVHLLAGKRLHIYESGSINNPYSIDRTFSFCSDGRLIYEYLFTSSETYDQKTTNGTWRVLEAAIDPNNQWGGARVESIDDQGARYVHEIVSNARGVRLNGSPAEVTNTTLCS
jgi:hypothetical protein